MPVNKDDIVTTSEFDLAWTPSDPIPEFYLSPQMKSALRWGRKTDEPLPRYSLRVSDWLLKWAKP